MDSTESRTMKARRDGQFPALFCENFSSSDALPPSQPTRQKAPLNRTTLDAVVKNSRSRSGDRSERKISLSEGTLCLQQAQTRMRKSLLEPGIPRYVQLSPSWKLVFLLISTMNRPPMILCLPSSPTMLTSNWTRRPGSANCSPKRKILPSNASLNAALFHGLLSFCVPDRRCFKYAYRSLLVAS